MVSWCIFTWHGIHPNINGAARSGPPRRQTNSIVRYLTEKHRKYIRQIRIHEQEQRESEEYPHRYVVRHDMKDLLSRELPYYRHELELLSLYDDKDKACDLEAEKYDEPEQDQENDWHYVPDKSIVINIRIHCSGIHVHSHTLEELCEQFDSNGRRYEIEARMKDHGIDDPACTDIYECEQYAEEEREKELLEIAVPEAEHDSRHRAANEFAVAERAVDHELSE